MTKIARKTAKIFSLTGPTGQVGQFGSYAAGAPVYTLDPDVIQALAAYTGGVYSALVNAAPIAFQDMNALGLLTSQQIAYLLQSGVPAYDSATTYYVGSLVKDSHLNVYISVATNNTNHEPSTYGNDIYWRIYGGGDIVPVTGNIYSVNPPDYLIEATLSGATPFLLILPTPSALNKGRIVLVKKMFSGGNVTVQAEDASQIDNRYDSYSWSTQYQTKRFICDGSLWMLI